MISEKQLAARKLFCSENGHVKLGLAPMAGVTDLPFRQLCFDYGADYAVSEMISAKGFLLNRKPNETVRALYAVGENETTGVQLFGCEPELIAQAAAAFEKRGCRFIDINMGCPMPKVTGNGEGSALMKTPKLAGQIVRETAKAIRLPLTVKIRSGWDEDSVNACEIAAVCEENGANAVCVHARTRTQLYSGHADWSVIAAVKRTVSIPVIGNGDVRDAASAKRMLEETGCDAIAIGRGAQGNPFVFDAVHAGLEGREALAITPLTVLATIRRHTQMLRTQRCDAVAVREMRKHIAWYLHGLRSSAKIRCELLTETDLDTVDRRLEEYLTALAKEDAAKHE